MQSDEETILAEHAGARIGARLTDKDERMIRIEPGDEQERKFFARNDTKTSEERAFAFTILALCDARVVPTSESSEHRWLSFQRSGWAIAQTALKRFSSCWQNA